jgi:protein involved in polysaccharide export with SLBB domain
LALALAVLAGCGGPERARPTAAPALRPLDEGLDLALASSLRSAPSPSPELDALVDAVAALTPELGLDELLAIPASELSLLRPGDRLSLAVMGREEFDVTLTVGPSGAVRVPLIGPVAAEGRTVAELAEELRVALERSYLRRAVVDLQATRRKARQVSLTGRVRKPGAYDLPPDRSLGLHGLLTLAEGLLDDADGARFKLLREDRCYHFSYPELLGRRVRGQRVWLQPGDQVVVPRLPDAYVQGAVEEPGRRPVRPGTTVGALLVAAGGLTEDADAAAMLLLRATGEEQPTNLDALVQPGTVVYVPRLQRVYVTGAVGRVGPLSMPRAGLTVLQALAEAGWFTETADQDGTTILRAQGSEGPKLIRVPVSELLAGERREREFRLRPGDLVTVPERVW